MKKIVVLLICVTLLLTMCVIGVAAAAPNLTGQTGVYCGGGVENFERVGDIVVTWVPDAMDKLNLKDGNLDDWDALNLTPCLITPANMVYFSSKWPETLEWEMTAYFLADKDYLYIGFYIVDPDVYACTSDNLANYRSGDAFQINVDFGGKLGWLIENDPEMAEALVNTKNVFYSFAYNGDGGPVGIYVQEADNDRLLTEADGVIGSTGSTDVGWCAEFTIPWQTMYDDYAWKSYLDDPEFKRIYVGGTEKKPLEIGVGLYYLNQGSDDAGDQKLTWAAGTHSGFTGTDANGDALDPATNPPLVRWDVYDNAMSLILEYQPGMEFTSQNIEVLELDETEPPTEKPTEPVTDAPTEAPTAAPTEAPTNAPTDGPTEEETEDTVDEPEKSGCSSMVSMGVVVTMLTFAFAVVARKKKD